MISVEQEIGKQLGHKRHHLMSDLEFENSRSRNCNDVEAPCINPWSQREVARRLGVSTEILSGWEAGFFDEAWEVLEKWCEILHTTYQDELVNIVGSVLDTPAVEEVDVKA